MSRIRNLESIGGEIVALSEEQAAAYPSVIYTFESDRLTDKAILNATLEAAQAAGLPVVADVAFNEEFGTNQIVIRSSSTERNVPKVESALFQGASSIAERTFNGLLGAGQTDQVEVLEAAKTTTEAAIRQITDNQSLSESFSNYYGGLRWGTDQESFVASLFEHAATFDIAELNKKMRSGSDVGHLVYDLDMDIPWERRSDWYDQTAEEVLANEPELDYHRLADPEVASSEEGQKLITAYSRLSGYIDANDYKRYPRTISDEGVITSKPTIPLANFPIIEMLLSDEISMTRPRAKYDFGASEVIGLILDSDSLMAQQTLAESATIRLPLEQRYVFDGPNEFEHKRRIVRDILRVYDNEADPQRREQFKDQLLMIFNAYTGDGVIAAEARAEYLERERQGHSLFYGSSNQVRDIVRDILTVSVASPDVATFMGRYMPDFEKSLTLRSDPLALTQVDMMLLVLDGTAHVDKDSDLNTIEHIVKRVFQDDNIGRTIRQIAELDQQAEELRYQPEVVLAMRKWRNKSGIFSDDPESDAAKAAWEEAVAPANAKAREASDLRNKLLFEYLESLVDQDLLSDESGTPNNIRLAKELVERLSFGDTWQMKELPTIYPRYMKLAEHPNLPDDIRNKMLWQFAERFKYADQETAQLLVPFVLEGYRILLGELGDLRIPNSETSHGLAALTHMARQVPIFKYANEGQLAALGRYKFEIFAMAERVTLGALSDGTDIDETTEPALEDWQVEALKNIQSVAREMGHLEECYQDYLHIEDVKKLPNVYYPWLMKQLVPFWHRMQREVSPGNRPIVDILELHQVLEQHIEGLLDFREDDYPEDFDVFEDGHLDSLILEGYHRMVVPHDIKYVNAVYHDGLSFMHYAINYMPGSVVEQFKAKYPEEKMFLEYLVNSRRRWNKDD